MDMTGAAGEGYGLEMCRDVSHMFIFGPFFFFLLYFLITNLFIIIYSLVTTTITATASTTHFPSLSTTWLVTGGINELV